MHRFDRFTRSALAFCAALGTTSIEASARADALSGELGGGVSRSGLSLPSSAFGYAKASGRISLSDAVQVSASLRETHDFSVDARSGEPFATSDDWVTLIGLGVSWDVSKHWALSVDLSGSPPSTRRIASDLDVTPARATVQPLQSSALVSATNANVGGTLVATFDSFDEDAEHTIDVSIDGYAGVTGFQTDQTISELETASGAAVTQSSLSAACGDAATDLLCATRTVPSQSAWLGQFRFGVTPMLTIAERTELALDAAVYLYDAGVPGSVGFFSDAVNGRTVNWGTGLPLLPARFSLRPELGEKFGPLALRAFYQFTETTIDGVNSHTVGGRAQLSAGRFKPFATGNVRFDTGEIGTTSWTLGLGLSRSF